MASVFIGAEVFEAEAPAATGAMTGDGRGDMRTDDVTVLARLVQRDVSVAHALVGYRHNARRCLSTR